LRRFFGVNSLEVAVMSARLFFFFFFLYTVNSPYNGGLMMRMLPRVEATGCMRRLLYSPWGEH
jgi:hypothetical protein